jgi:hypothetical protein
MFCRSVGKDSNPTVRNSVAMNDEHHDGCRLASMQFRDLVVFLPYAAPFNFFLMLLRIDSLSGTLRMLHRRGSDRLRGAGECSHGLRGTLQRTKVHT